MTQSPSGVTSDLKKSFEFKLGALLFPKTLRAVSNAYGTP